MGFENKAEPHGAACVGGEADAAGIERGVPTVAGGGAIAISAPEFSPCAAGVITRFKAQACGCRDISKEVVKNDLAGFGRHDIAGNFKGLKILREAGNGEVKRGSAAAFHIALAEVVGGRGAVEHARIGLGAFAPRGIAGATNAKFIGIRLRERWEGVNLTCEGGCGRAVDDDRLAEHTGMKKRDGVGLRCRNAGATDAGDRNIAGEIAERIQIEPEGFPDDGVISDI